MADSQLIEDASMLDSDAGRESDVLQESSAEDRSKCSVFFVLLPFTFDN